MTGRDGDLFHRSDPLSSCQPLYFVHTEYCRMVGQSSFRGVDIIANPESPLVIISNPLDVIPTSFCYSQYSCAEFDPNVPLDHGICHPI